jgi:hypothetical protein
MAKQQAARKRSQSKGDTEKKTAGSGTSENGSGGGTATYEEELAEYLQERIKPNLNRGSIPMLARSIAKDLAKRQRPDDEPEESEETDEPRAEADEEADEPRGDADDDREAEEEPEAEEDEDFEDEAEEEPEAEEDEDVDDEDEEEPEAEEEPEGEADDAVTAFEEEMHQLQEDLGDEWIVRFSVQGDEAWLTAEKEDGTQHVEGPTADVLREAVELLEEGGGRSD